MSSIKLLSPIIIFSIILFSVKILNGQQIKKDENIDDELAKRFQTILEQQRDLLNTPGITAAVILPDNKEWLGASGYSSEKDSIKPDMLLGLGSVSKTYIAALLLKLAEEKKLSVDDTINKWLPDMQYVNGTITIRQLLNHTSGLYRYQGTTAWFQEITTKLDKVWQPAEIIRTFVKEPVGKPGSVWGESAADYVLLGMIIEKATGRKVVELLHELIISPLHLQHTYLYPDEVFSSEELAHFWWDVNHTGKPVDIYSLVYPAGSKTPFKGMFSSVWTSGAIIATAEDLAKFSKALFEKRVLSESSFNQMITPVQLNSSPEYGFSVVIDTINGKKLYWHSGGIGYTSIFFNVPDDKLTIAVLCNSYLNPKPVAEELYKGFSVYMNSKE